MSIQNASKGAIGIGAVVMIIIALLVVVIVAIVVLNSQSAATAAPAFSNNNNPVPTQLSTMSTLSSIAATQNLVVLAQQHLANISQYTMLYQGTLKINPSGLAGAVASINSPFFVNVYKFSSASKFSLNVTSVPIIGRLNLAYVNSSNGSFLCSNVNTTAISGKSPQSALSGSGAITCANVSTLSTGINVAQVANFNLSSMLQGTGINFVYSKVYQTSYHGIPCTYLTGPIENSTSAQIGSFQMCISNTYYVPLSLWVSASNSQGSFSMAMNETQITNSSSQSEVESLPGPVR